MIETVYYDGEAVVVLDQNKLPGEIAYEGCRTPGEVAHAIRTLKVRGAPLIGVAAAFGLALGIARYQGPRNKLNEYFQSIKEELAGTRPTAVNLFWALQRMEAVFQTHAQQPPAELGQILLQEAQTMFAEDVRSNRRIGDHGAPLLQDNSRVMTICNAGALATCGYGTALGVIRSAYPQGKISKVWACETRPVLQGARLTVWELMQDGIPVTLITDNMAGYIMKLGEVDAVIVGADRIAANGDTANKIGTYTLAVLAEHHRVPFYVAAPLSTLDLSIPSGSAIPIEERNQQEVRSVRGVSLTVDQVQVFNPAFDVTHHELISGIITEKGVLRPPYEQGLRQCLERTEPQ